MLVKFESGLQCELSRCYDLLHDPFLAFEPVVGATITNVLFGRAF